jgi:hypothetical protein
MSHPHKSSSRKRSLWSLRYKAYVVVLLVVIIPLLGFSSSNIPQSIDFVGSTIIPKFPWYSEVVRRAPNSIVQLVQDVLDSEVVRSGEISYATSDIEKTIQDEIEKNRNLPLDKLIPRPSNPQLKSFLKYPDYSINAPLIYSEMKDLFETNPDGSLKKNTNGQFIPIEEKQEDIDRGNYLSVPIQRLLVDGVVHIAYTVNPGEIGNSYVIGHTSNFSAVKSAYNTVFKPIERRSKIGETFVVYDKFGRELNFKVFEVLEIQANDTATAYKRFDDKRVVTLQGSILDANFQPTKRWLTRGELILP